MSIVCRPADTLQVKPAVSGSLYLGGIGVNFGAGADGAGPLGAPLAREIPGAVRTGCAARLQLRIEAVLDETANHVAMARQQFIQGAGVPLPHSTEQARRFLRIVPRRVHALSFYLHAATHYRLPVMEKQLGGRP